MNDFELFVIRNSCLRHRI